MGRDRKNKALLRKSAKTARENRLNTPERWKTRCLMKEKMFKDEKEKSKSILTQVTSLTEQIRVACKETSDARMEILKIRSTIEKYDNEQSQFEEKLRVEAQEHIAQLNQEIEYLSQEIEAVKRVNLISTRKSAEKRKEENSVQKTPSSSRNLPSKSSLRPEIAINGTFGVAMSVYKKRIVTNCVLDSLFKLSNDDEAAYVMLLRLLMKESSSRFPSFRLTLNVDETLLLRTKLHLSDQCIKNMKSFFNEKLGMDVIGSRLALAAERRQNSVVDEYEYVNDAVSKVFDKKTVTTTSCRAFVKDLKKSLSRRLTLMETNGRLIFNEYTKDEIVICLLGDKGGDETKLVLAVANQEAPNSPHSLLLLGMYEGNDSYEELSGKMSHVFHEFNSITSIEYTENGQQRTRAVRRHVISDYKFLSAVYGHAGPSCGFPCIHCSMEWSYRGKDAVTVGNLDITAQWNYRTQDSFRKDLISRANGVVHKPLLNIEPCNVLIPTFHLTQGLFERYGEQFILGTINQLDKVGLNGKTLRQQKKELADLTKQELALRKDVDEYITAKDEASCASTVFHLIISNPLCHVKRPQRVCDAEFCIVNHMRRDSDCWVLCDFCSKDFHFYCTSVFCPEKKKLLALPSTKFQCDACLNMDIHGHKTMAADEADRLQSRVDEMEQKIDRVSMERHNTEGVINRSTGSVKKEYDEILTLIGCNPKIWYQRMTGNQTRRALRKENLQKIFAILPDTSQNRNAKNALIALSELMTASSSKLYNDNDIKEVEQALDRFVAYAKLAFPKESVTPKFHSLVFHLLPQVKKLKSWGFVSEQSVEHTHGNVNDMKLQFGAVRKPEDRMRLIVQEMGLNNYLFDRGLLR